jgi:hypothetical protein
MNINLTAARRSFDNAASLNRDYMLASWATITGPALMDEVERLAAENAKLRAALYSEVAA